VVTNVIPTKPKTDEGERMGLKPLKSELSRSQTIAGTRPTSTVTKNPDSPNLYESEIARLRETKYVRPEDKFLNKRKIIKASNEHARTIHKGADIEYLHNGTARTR